MLYAVLLAFIAVARWERFSRATELVEAEANLAGNLYRVATEFSHNSRRHRVPSPSRIVASAGDYTALNFNHS